MHTLGRRRGEFCSEQRRREGELKETERADAGSKV